MKSTYENLMHIRKSAQDLHMNIHIRFTEI